MSKTILCVDNEPNLLELYEEILTMEGYEVIAAENGAQALQQLDTQTIDLVVLDIRLGNEDGRDILKEMRRDYPDLPVILHSGYSSYKSDFQTWLATDFVVKTPDLGGLKTRIRKLLQFDV